MSQKIIYLIGVPTSGKSTWAKKFALKNPSFRIISRDAIREMLYGEYKMVYKDEDVITDTLVYLKDMLLAEGLDVIMDNTNCKLGHLKLAIESDKDFDFQVEFIDFPLSREEFIERNDERSERTGKNIPIFVFDKMEEGRNEVVKYIFENEVNLFTAKDFEEKEAEIAKLPKVLNYDEGAES